MFAYIPARGGSKRIPQKNIKLLDGKPLIVHVIENLKKVPELTGIAVSTDDKEVMEIVSSIQGVETLEYRNVELATDEAGIGDLIRNDIPRYVDFFKDDDVLIVFPTAILVGDIFFKQALNLHKDNGGRGLVLGVTKYELSPFLALEENQDGELKPLFPEKYLLPTKDLQLCYGDSGSFYGLNLKSFKNTTKLIDLVPISPVVLPSDVGIDLDTTEDWERLEKSYNFY